MFSRVVPLLVAVAALAVTSTIQAGDFTVVNRSNTPIFVAYRYYSPRTYAFDNSFSEASWATEGWFKILPGETKMLYRTDQPKILVRVNAQGRFDSPFAINPSDGQERHWVHTTEGFTTNQFVDSNDISIQSGSPRRLNDVQRVQNTRVVGGFYIISSEYTLTIR